MLALSGCAAPGYYLQAASGQAALLRARQDIDEYLRSADRDPALAGRLRTARGILEFAKRELALPAGGSYRTFAVTGKDAVVWNVVATPEFSLQPRRWCFLVAGCVPYLGYFERNRAEAHAARLSGRGMDVHVSGAQAYSTLGWFEDPVLDTMLRRTDAQLAASLVHELAHQRLYVKGDTDFNESYASFVARQGTQQWLTALGQAEDAGDWRRQQIARDRFQSLLVITRRKLARLYASGAPEAALREGKRRIFAQLKADHDDLARRLWNGQGLFDTWFDTPLNNARLALANSYQGGICAFGRLFSQSGASWPEFHRRAQALADGPAERRSAWLGAPCENPVDDIARLDHL